MPLPFTTPDPLPNALNLACGGPRQPAWSFPNALCLGIAATPTRAGLDGLFDRMIVGPSMRDLINQRFLTDYRVLA